ncbi:hypothetical protein DITRI_Ditri12bG0115500 [Diplodiscus trichospermus]
MRLDTISARYDGTVAVAFCEFLVRGSEGCMQNKNYSAMSTLMYADFMFESWKNEVHEDDPSSSRGPLWFKMWYNKRSRRHRPGNRGLQYRDRNDDDIENIFRSAFGGSRFFYWSFINEENPHWGSSYRYSNNYEESWNGTGDINLMRVLTQSGTFESLDRETVADRQALGLSACGPLTFEDIKSA